MPFIRASVTPALSVEAAHVLRAALLRREETDSPEGQTTTNGSGPDTEARMRRRRELIANMDSSQISKAIIKNEAMDRRMHALAIARRLHYCLNA